MTQEIIVYRNPLEKAMWDSLMSGDGMLIIAGFIAAFIVSVSIVTLLEKVPFVRRHRYTSYGGNLQIVVLVISFIATLYVWAKVVM